MREHLDALLLDGCDGGGIWVEIGVLFVDDVNQFTVTVEEPAAQMKSHVVDISVERWMSLGWRRLSLGRDIV